MKKGFDSVNVHGCLSGIIAIPAIGENGNWFLGNDDTEVAAKGADGAVGEQGPQGLKGDQGEIGPAGPQGIQGIQGEKGDQGIQGIQGETGIQGEKGDQGIKGIQGEKGEQGEIGPVGPQGIQGDQGEKGTDADAGELERLSKEVDALDLRVKEVFQSVSSGKALVASAITDKGVTTVADATFQTMATNIKAVAEKQYTSGYNNGYASATNGMYHVSIVSGSWAISSGTGFTQNSTSASINIASVCSNYGSVNADMCIFEPSYANANVNGTLGIGTHITKSYNASTGVLTVTLNYDATNAMVRSLSGRVLVYWKD